MSRLAERFCKSRLPHMLSKYSHVLAQSMQHFLFFFSFPSFPFTGGSSAATIACIMIRRGLGSFIQAEAYLVEHILELELGQG